MSKKCRPILATKKIPGVIHRPKKIPSSQILEPKISYGPPITPILEWRPWAKGGPELC